MKRLVTTLTSLILLINTQLHAKEVYRVIDAEGGVTFTDSPAAKTEAETVNLPKVNIAPPPPLHANDEDTVNEEASIYTSARIIQPLNNATIPPGQTTIVVKLALKPPLQKGHLTQLYIDGQTQGQASEASAFSISNLHRGQHSARIEVLGRNKKRKIQTNTVIFHVKQHSANR